MLTGFIELHLEVHLELTTTDSMQLSLIDSTIR